jgi:hypothetical protein
LLWASHDAARRYLKGCGESDRISRSPQIATGDLDIAVVGQLPSTNLPFGDQFEPRPVKVVRF